MVRTTIVALAVWAVLLSPLCSAQQLDRARDEVRESKPSPAESSGRRRRQRTYEPQYDADYLCPDDEPNPLEKLTGTILLAGLTSPFTIPRAALEESEFPGFFPKYPYGKSDGSLLFDETAPGAHSSLLVLQGDYGTDFDSLTQAHARVFGDIKSRLGFDTEFYYREEALRPGTDRLWHGDFNVTYRFAHSEHWQFRAGLGVNWLTDDFDSNAGLNATYGAEWFPVKPLSVTSTLDWGRIGATSLLHFRNTIGLTKSGWGVFTGHDWLRVGGEDIHSWINGIEYRF